MSGLSLLPNLFNKQVCLLGKPLESCTGCYYLPTYHFISRIDHNGTKRKWITQSRIKQKSKDMRILEKFSKNAQKVLAVR